MEKILDTLKMLGFFILSILILGFISALINLITPLSMNVLSLFTTIIMILIFFILGIKKGKTSNSKGWLCGLKNGFILSLTLLLVSLIFFTKNINFATLIYYTILILANVFGSIIGINKKKDA